MTTSPLDTTPAAQPSHPHVASQPLAGTHRRRANRWLTVLTGAVIAAQVIAGCGPARTRGAAGGMDASLLENASVQVSSELLAMAPAPGISDAAFPAPQIVDLQSIPTDTLAALASAQPLNAEDRTTVESVAVESVADPEPALVAGSVVAPVAAEAPISAAAFLPAAASAMVQTGDLQQPILPDTQPVMAPSHSGANVGVAANASPLDKTTNILILGSDRRVGAPNWLTDVMMIVALDYANGKAGVISIPRDIYIDQIAGHQSNKLNVVDYLGEKDRAGGGGPELLSDILFEKLGVRIDHYVRFDFRGFIALVDALDGVEVEIDCPYYDYFSIENVILNVKPGIERLSGDEALVYVRSRKIGGDLDRARRQQRFVWAVRNQVLNENILPRLPALYNAVSNSVQTDLGIVGTLKIARFALGLDKEDITGFVIGYPLVEQGWVGNMWVFRAHWDEIRAEMQNVFQREPFIDTNTLVECP